MILSATMTRLKHSKKSWNWPVDENVDFIILAGDLFHFSKPTPDCLNRCLSLLRKYCVGQRRSTYELISKESDVFNHCNFQTANVTDPSLNIAMAIYSIHGNHDDPTGVQRVSALDLLSTCGLVNYFGKWSDLNKINIVPLLFQKKESRLAVYGKFLHWENCLCNKLYKGIFINNIYITRYLIWIRLAASNNPISLIKIHTCYR